MMRTLRPAPIYVHHHRRSPSSHAPRCKATTNDAIAQTTQQLITLIQEIGMPASILPGSEPQRQQIDAIINALPATVQQPTGETQWRLVYASNGTYVTRQPIIQALVALSQLPGTGLQDVQQRLCVAADSQQGAIRSSNGAVFGLGPLGSYEIQVEGDWQWREKQREGGASRGTQGPTAGTGTTTPTTATPDMVADISFDKFCLTPRGVLGLPLPTWLQQTVQVPLSGGSAAEWRVLYGDDKLRVCSGASGNTFVFVRV